MSQPVGAVHHVGIVVRDLDQVEAFFTTAFGFPVVNRIASEELGMRATFLAGGPAVVELIEFSDPQVVQERLGDRPAAIDHVALQVDDLDAAVASLAAHGVQTVHEAPVTTPVARWHFTKADTSGGVAWQLLELVA